MSNTNRFERYAQKTKQTLAEDVAALENSMRENKLTVADVAAFAYIKCSKNDKFKEYARVFLATARKIDGVVKSSIEADRVFANVSMAAMTTVVTKFRDRNTQTVSCLNVISELCKRGVQYEYELTDDGASGKIIFRKGTDIVLDNLKFGFPVCGIDLKDFVRKVVGDPDLQVIGFNHALVRITAYVCSIVQFREDKTEEYRSVVLKSVSNFETLMGPQPHMMKGNKWLPEIVTAVEFLFSTENIKGIHSILRRPGRLDPAVLYCIWREALSDDEIKSLMETLLKRCGVKVGKSTPAHLAESTTRGISGALQYLERRRATMGEDKAYGSVLSRNLGLFPGINHEYYTAFKWDKILGSQNFVGAVDNIVVAGCKPGHFYNVVAENLKPLIKEVSVEDDWEDAKEKKSNIRFIDLIPCTAKNGFRWDTGDVLNLEIKSNMLLVSDAWVDGDGTVKKKFLNDIIKALWGYLCGSVMMKDSVLKKFESKLRNYAVKLNIEFPDDKHVQRTAEDVPPAIKILVTKIQAYNKVAEEKDRINYPFITKIGRPHNQEVVLTSWKMHNSVCLDSLESIKMFFKKMASDMVTANFARIQYQMGMIRYTPVTLKGMTFAKCPSTVQIEVVQSEELAQETMELQKLLEFEEKDFTSDFDDFDGGDDHQDVRAPRQEEPQVEEGEEDFE